MLFQGLFKRAERSIDSAISKFVGRATVAVPLLVAGGFATAALSLKLVELYGHVSAYAIMAVLFTVIALLTMAVNNKESEPAGETTAATDTAEAAQGADEEGSGPQLPPEVMALLTSVAPTAAPGIARGVVRNLPLIFLLAIAAFVISRFAEASASGDHSPSDAEADAQGAPAP